MEVISHSGGKPQKNMSSLISNTIQLTTKHNHHYKLTNNTGDLISHYPKYFLIESCMKNIGECTFQIKQSSIKITLF